MRMTSHLRKLMNYRFAPKKELIRLLPLGGFVPSQLLVRLVSSSSSQGFSSSTLLISSSARARLGAILRDEPSSYLRVSVEGGGCSGFQYKFQLDNKPKERDDVMLEDGNEEQKCRVVIDKTSLEILKGARIDFEEELIRLAFKIVDIPAAEAGCSCGASFNVKQEL